MQKVSNEYKASMKSSLRERSYMMISFGLVNQEAQANATVMGNNFAYYSKQTGLFGQRKEDTVYATLEHDFTKVDGSMYFLPRENTSGNYYDTGLISKPLIPKSGYELLIELNVVATDIKGLTTLTAPAKSSYNQSGHYYGVQIIAKDEAGNTTTVNQSDTTLGSKLRLTVKEKTAPVITISSPTASQLLTSNQPTISFTVTDDDSGVNPDTIKLLIDGSEISGITKTKTTSGYSCSYKPSTALSDGSHTVVVKASDYDGNAATQKSVSFKIDTVPPELSVTSPVNKLVTNKTTVTVAGTTNDATSSPVTLTINGSAVTVYDDGTFSKDITLKDGSNTITVVAKDGVGRTTTVTRTVTLDTKAPVISDVSLAPNPADVGATYVISVSVTD